MDQNMVDAASGGALIDKTLVVARHLILNMVVRGLRRTRHLKGSEGSWQLRQLTIGESVDRTYVPYEATYCRVASTSNAMSVWNLHLSGAP
ncbi:hypothetical protein CR513_09542, partial [Mucuna pruriens]